MNTLTQTIAISKDTVSELPVVNYPGGITLVDTPEKARDAIRELTLARVVGFDTETRPSFQRGKTHNVALLQLSTEDHCYLFRLNTLGISEPLKEFLEDPRIIKVGLSVHDDFSVMRRMAPNLDPAGFIDLQEYVKYFHINDISLQKIYAIVFSEKISKQQRLTNWEAETLTENQQKYAALDAWACLRLYRTLRSGQFHPDESPYVVDRCQLCASQNNQLIGPKQAAEHAAALKRAEEKQAAQQAQAQAAKDAQDAKEAQQAKKKSKSKKSTSETPRRRAASTHRSRKSSSSKK